MSSEQTPLRRAANRIVGYIEDSNGIRDIEYIREDLIERFPDAGDILKDRSLSEAHFWGLILFLLKDEYSTEIEGESWMDGD